MRLALDANNTPDNSPQNKPTLYTAECLTNAASIAVTLAYSGHLVHRSSDGALSGQVDASLGAYRGALKPIKTSTGKKKADKASLSSNVSRESVSRAVGIVEGKIEVIYSLVS
jgi:hypothetical protein